MTDLSRLPPLHQLNCAASSGSPPSGVVGFIGRRPAVVGTGLVALDVIYGLDQTRAPDLYAGGTCGNVLAALAFLGWESYPIARLADDPAGRRVLRDLASCGVQTDFASLEPRRPTPIILQRIRLDGEGQVVHRFATRCPSCGAFFPQYTPVPREPLAYVTSSLPSPEVVFVDRVSPSAVLLAETAYQNGALIYFEPSAACDARLVGRMLEVVHILKYSQERAHLFARPSHASVPLEIETRGPKGLRYRGTMFGRSGRAWRSLPGFAVSQLRDAAGAGDWMSAGLIDFVAQAGAEGFEALPRDLIEDGLQTAQAYSAWACGFEGARGGMYRESVGSVRDKVARTLAAGVVDTVPVSANCATPFDVLDELCGGCGPGPTAKHASAG